MCIEVSNLPESEFRATGAGTRVQASAENPNAYINQMYTGSIRFVRGPKTWMPGTRPGMTEKSIQRDRKKP
jgi:hypothetical protein